MNALTRIGTLALVTSVMTIATSKPADAQIRFFFGNGGGLAISSGGGGGASYHDHGHGHNHGLPKLGFFSHVDYGEGLHITGVRYGSPAWQLGLREGDTIESLNEFSLAYGGWNQALRDAMNHHDGYVELCVHKRWGGHEHVTWHFHDDGHGHAEYSYSGGA